jgi:hypothetical protein
MEDFKNNIEKEIPSLLKDFIDKHMPKRKMHMFTGKVEDNNDPDQLGRCKIRVYGLFDDVNIATSDLPWAKPDNQFIGSNIGSFIVPPVDTLVRVYFDGDDIYNPVYTTKVLNTSQLSTNRSEDYPHTLVMWETDNGDFFQINRKTLEMELRHSSGLDLTIDANGNVTIKNVDVEQGNITLNVKGNVNLTSDGNVSVEAPKGNIKLAGDSATQPCNNLPSCIFSGSPHAIGGQFPGQRGSTLVRP